MVSAWRTTRVWYSLPVLAALVAVWGIGYGLPLHLIGDEESLVGGALKMLELRTLVPSFHPAEFDFLYYPPVMPYLIILFSLPVILWQFLANQFSAVALQDFFSLNQESMWIAARSVSAASSVAMVFLLYHLGKLLFTRRIAVLAGLLLSFSFLHVNAAHWARHWMLATLVAYGIVYLAVRLVQRRDVPWWSIALTAAFGIGVSYITAVGALFAATYLYYHRSRIPQFWPFVVRSALLFIVVAALFVGLHYGELIELLGREEGSAAQAKSAYGLLLTIGYGMRVLLRQETVIILAAVAALMFARRFVRSVMVIFGMMILYFTILYGLFHIEMRYVYFILPALTLAAAIYCDELWRRRRAVALFFLSIGIAYQAAVVVRYDALLFRPDTRTRAMEWIESNIRDEEFVMSSRSLQLPRSREALRREQELGRLRAAERYALMHFDRLDASAMRFNYTNLHFWLPERDLSDLNEYVGQYRPRYFIVEYWDRGDLDGKDFSLMAGSTLLTEFRQSDGENNLDINGNFFATNAVLFSMQRLGPIVQVYYVRPNTPRF